MLQGPLFQGQGIPCSPFDRQACHAVPRHLICHSHSPVKGGPGVPVTGIEQIEPLFGEVEPRFIIKVGSMIITDHPLKLSLPIRDGLDRKSTRLNSVTWPSRMPSS